MIRAKPAGAKGRGDFVSYYRILTVMLEIWSANHFTYWIITALVKFGLSIIKYNIYFLHTQQYISLGLYIRLHHLSLEKLAQRYKMSHYNIMSDLQA